MKTLIKTRELEGLEIREYTTKKATKLLFLQHGIYSNKENVTGLLGVTLAKIGYHVLAIDAYKHGSRSEEPFLSKDEDYSTLETMPVVKQTAEDILTVYTNHYKDDYPTFDILGISMGGLIAYYLSTRTHKINTLIALISSPRFLEAAEHTFPKEKQSAYKEASAQALKLIKEMDPSTRIETMYFKRMIMMNGKNDLVIPHEQSLSFKNEHPDLNITLKLYDTEHKITKAMQKDLIYLLK